MNKTMAFVRLDMITIKPYLTLKNFLIFAAVALVMILTSGDSSSALGILMIYSVIFGSYPFAVGEKNGIDALYATLSIGRSTVVAGRYLFAAFLNLCAGILSNVFAFAALTIMGKAFNLGQSIIVTLILFLVYGILQAVQLPIYFKLGYAKAKLAAYLPFVGLPLIILVLGNFFRDVINIEAITNILGWLEANPLITAALGVAVWLAAQLISYRISASAYARRDL